MWVIDDAEIIIFEFKFLHHHTYNVVDLVEEDTFLFVWKLMHIVVYRE